MCRKGYDIQMNTPNIHEFMSQFKNEKEFFNCIVEHIYPDGKPVCPYCGCSEHIYKLKKHQTEFRCGHCNKVITATSGTMFEYTLVSYKNWFYIMYSMFVSRRSISNYQLVRETHISDTTIYRIRRKIQAAMGNFDFEPFSGIVEMDECFCGGSNHGRFCKEGEGKESKKYPILGIYDRPKNKVYSYAAISNEKGQYLTGEQLKTFITKTCAPGSVIVTDEFKGYNFLNKPDSCYYHTTVDHSRGQRANEEGFTTNGIEGYWGAFKKMYYSTHSNLPKDWVHLYLAECDFRYNHNDWKEAIDTLLKQAVFFPRVIDIRKMGKHANKTYNLKDYRMILPKCFNDIDIKNITIEDILNCDEPVYGILINDYKTRKQLGYSGENYPPEWQKLGLIAGGYGYRDYRDTIVNTKEDIANMIKTATKHKEVNKLAKIRRIKKQPSAKRKRINRIRRAYEELPPILQTQIKQEYPHIMKISAKEKTREIHNRMISLSYWYRKNQKFLEGN